MAWDAGIVSRDLAHCDTRLGTGGFQTRFLRVSVTPEEPQAAMSEVIMRGKLHSSVKQRSLVCNRW